MRRRSGSPVSFFAFQDIITAVSGILIVVVLLLCLELVERREAEAAPAPARAGELRDAVAAAEAERESLAAAIDDEATATAAAAGTSAGELRREIADLRAEAARLEGQVEHAAADGETLRRAEEELEVRRFDQADVTSRLESAQRRARETAARLEEARRDDRVVYELPRGHARPGWVVVLGGDEIAAAPIGRPSPPTAFHGSSPFGSSAADRFLEWSEAHVGEYFLLLVRPDGIDAFDRIDAAFQASSASYGFDVVGRDRVVLHPERGAAP